MFKLTEALKAYAVANFGLKESDSEAQFRRVVALKLTEGALSAAKYRELCASAVATPPARKAPTRPLPVRPTPGRPAQAPAIDGAALDAAIEKGVQAALERQGLSGEGSQKALTPQTVLTKSDPVRVRVKVAAERYSHNRKDAYYPQRTGRRGQGTAHLLAGQLAQFSGTKLYHPSDLDKAVCCAYWKWCLKSVVPAGELRQHQKMTDHDMDLLNWSMRNHEWTGLIGGSDVDHGAIPVNRRKLTDFEIKALLDDSTSGGIEATPYVFDDALVLLPVLYGELFPLVNTVNVAQGRRMKGASMENIEFTSGTAEGTAITPFVTTDFVGAFDTTIYPSTAAIEVGLDFEEDSPVDMGAQIVENAGLKALEYLDRVVAVGDGTTEPQGIFNASGVTTITSDNGAGGPLTVSDFEGLMFGVAKEFRKEAGATCVYVSNDTMYRRARGIDVGAGDQRRVFGMDHGSYMLMDQPYKVQNDIGSGKIAYVNLKRYRMYRRLGMAVRYENTGATLARSNTRLVVMRQRYGGKMERGGAMCKVIDAHGA